MRGIAGLHFLNASRRSYITSTQRGMFVTELLPMTAVEMEEHPAT